MAPADDSDHPSELAGPDLDLDPPPPEVRELAEALRQYVLSALEVELDYGPETLPVLDHYLRQARDNVRERPELADLLTQGVGAYFGEVVRIHYAAFWRMPTRDPKDWQLCFEDVFLAFSPVGVAWDALHESAEHEGPSSELVLDREDREAVERRLADLPPVSEEEYFLLSTRAEILEIVEDQLRLELSRAKLDSVEYGPADYEVIGRPIGQA